MRSTRWAVLMSFGRRESWQDRSCLPVGQVDKATRLLRLDSFEFMGLTTIGNLWRIDHEICAMVGGERLLASKLTVIIRPRWHTGHSRSEWPVSCSYRSR
jgi:hypothetical protein